jgi:hypothetical protein
VNPLFVKKKAADLSNFVYSLFINLLSIFYLSEFALLNYNENLSDNENILRSRKFVIASVIFKLVIQQITYIRFGPNKNQI